MSEFDAPYDNMLRMQAFEKEQKAKHQAAAAVLGNINVEPWFAPAGLELSSLEVIPLKDYVTVPVTIIPNLKTDNDVLDLIKNKLMDTLSHLPALPPRYDYEVICDQRNNSQDSLNKGKMIVDFVPKSYGEFAGYIDDDAPIGIETKHFPHKEPFLIDFSKIRPVGKALERDTSKFKHFTDND